MNISLTLADFAVIIGLFAALQCFSYLLLELIGKYINVVDIDVDIDVDEAVDMEEYRRQEQETIEEIVKAIEAHMDTEEDGGAVSIMVYAPEDLAGTDFAEMIPETTTAHEDYLERKERNKPSIVRRFETQIKPTDDEDIH
jgi:hypothetical protein